MDSPTLLETHFDEFFPAVRRCLLRRVLDPELADELTAETFFRAARRLDKLPDEPRRIQMWLFRIATNVAISFFRKSTTTRAMLHRFSAGSTVSNTRPCDSSTGEDQARLRSLIGKLPPNYQSVVVLRYFAHLPFEEIATMIECGKVAVRVRLSRAIRLMRSRAAEPTRREYRPPDDRHAKARSLVGVG